MSPTRESSRLSTPVVAGFTALLFVGLLFTAMPVAAFDFTTVVVSGAFGEAGDVSLVSFGDGVLLAIGYDGETIEDLIQHRSTDSGASWGSAQAIATLGDVGRWNSFKAVSSTKVAGCFYDTTNTDLKYAESNDKGLLWSTATTLITSADDVGASCSFLPESSSIYHVAFINDTNDLAYHVKSTNGGVSWGTATTIYSQDVWPISAGKYDLAMDDSGELLIALQRDSDTQIISCNSADSGASWTCSESGFTGSNPIAQHINGDRWGIIYRATSSFLASFARTDNDGVSWATTTFGEDGDGTMPTGALLVDTATEFLFVALDETSGNTCAIVTHQTTDAGSSWSAEEADVPTGDGGCTGDGGGLNADYVDAVVLPNGDLGLLFLMGADGQFQGTPSTMRFASSPFTDAPAGGAFDAVSTVSVTALRGIDVDRTGNNLITNQANGVATTIATYNALSLTAVETAATSCNQIESVFAMESLVAYIDCDSGDPDFLRIRTLGLTEPDLSGNCQPAFGSAYCSPNWMLTDGASTFEDNDDMIHITDIQSFPIDLSNNRDQGSSGVTPESYGAWAYSTGTGKVGVAMFTASNLVSGPEVRRNQATAQFSAPDVDPDMMCAWLYQGDEYLAAVQQERQTKVWRADFSVVREQGVDELQGVLTPLITYGSTQGSGSGIACAGNRTAVINDIGGETRIRLVNAFTGTQLDSLVIADSGSKGLAMSADGKFLTWADTDVGYIANITADTLNIVGSVTLGGSYTTSSNGKGAFMDTTGGNAWYATTSLIERFAISSVTCLDDCGIEPETGVTPGDAVAGDGLFSGAGATVGRSIGTSTFGGNLFLGAVLIGLVSFGAGYGGGRFVEGGGTRWNWGAASIGAIIGFLMAWGFGFFTTGVVFAAVVLVLGVLVFRFTRGSG